jgi:hypothetical protein
MVQRNVHLEPDRLAPYAECFRCVAGPRVVGSTAQILASVTLLRPRAPEANGPQSVPNEEVA